MTPRKSTSSTRRPIVALLRLMVGAAWAIGGVFPQVAAAQEIPRQPVVLIDDAIDRGGEIATMLRTTTERTKVVVAGVRVLLPDTMDEAGLVTLDRHLARYPTTIAIWLRLPAPRLADNAEAWRAMLRRVLAVGARRVTGLEIDLDTVPTDLALFAVRSAASEGRAANNRLVIALGGPDVDDSERLRQLYVAETAPYLDRLVIGARADRDDAARLLERVDPTAQLIVAGQALPEQPVAAARACVASVLWDLGSVVRASAWSGPAAALSSCLTALAPASGLLTGEILALDDTAAGLTLTIDGQVAGDVRARLLFDQQQQSTWLVYQAPPGRTPLGIEVRLATDGRTTLTDFESTAAVPAPDSARNASTGVTHVAAPRTGRPMLLGFNEGASAGFTDRAGVTATRALSVDDIVARHQQQQLTQDSLVDNYVAAARTEQHFRPTVTDSGYDVVSENVYYVDRSGIEWEERAFSVNGSRWGNDRPAFPMLQPEKVLSLPLALRLGDDYRYQLIGDATVAGIACYELAFEPVSKNQSLYKGTVWIDRQTFARVRVKAVQTTLAAPVVSNEEIQTYKTVTTIDGRPIVLLSELVAHQIVLIAGRNLLLEKRAVFGDFRVNADDFVDARQAARASDRIMFRETDRGLRYYNKEGGARVVAERGTARAKAMAMGVLIDPSYRFPLPLGGINYLDFEVGGRSDTQLALLFAGVLAAGNVQRPKVGNTPFDVSVDFFAIATPAWDRLFDQGQEREDEALLTWPLSSSVNLGWQANAFLKVSTQYQFRFDGFARDSTTDDSFVVPSSTTTHGIGAAGEYRRGGYSIVANATVFRRSSWKTWGAADALQTAEDSRARYAKYSVIVSRDFHLDAFQKLHIDAGMFGGRDLDRFSRYQFGMFDDTRIHGVPASGIRFDELRLLRGSYSFNIFEQYRLDLFLEQAWGQDRPTGRQWQPLTGTGVGVNMRAPWNTILRVDFGHSFLPDRYSGLGSTTLQVMVLKPLR